MNFYYRAAARGLCAKLAQAGQHQRPPSDGLTPPAATGLVLINEDARPLMTDMYPAKNVGLVDLDVQGLDATNRTSCLKNRAADLDRGRTWVLYLV